MTDKIIQPLLPGVRQNVEGPEVQSGHKGMYFNKPGTGPAGRTCQSCKYLVKFKQANTWYKCERCRSWWTGSPNTDVRVRTPACSGYEEETS